MSARAAPKPPRLVSAGAGSGKTHRIVEEVVGRVREGTPIDRIAAVTFTEAAASELQERLRGRLLEEGLRDEAARVEGAMICTIHQFALSVLKRFPLAAGISPVPMVLDQEASKTLLERAMEADLRAVAAGPRRRWLEESFGEGVGLTTSAYDAADRPEGRLRAVVRMIIDRCRSLAMSAEAVALEGEAATGRLRAAMPPAGDPAALERALAHGHALALRWLDDNPAAPTKKDQGLHDLLVALRAEPPASPLDHAMRVARCDRGVKTGVALAPLLQAAAAVCEGHPEMARRVEAATRGAYECAARVLLGYQEEKTRLGAVDFEDMQARAFELLTGGVEGSPAYAPMVADALPVIVVDEFQDTSPLQYVLFDVLRRAGSELTLVGDLKQGIYGFRSADSTLFAALLGRADAAGGAETLDRSRRSRPELVRFANGLFSALLPTAGMRFDALGAENAYTRGAAPAAWPCVDVLWHGRPHLRDSRVEPGVARVLSLLAEGREVLDRTTGAARPMRPGDIAVLAYDHAHLARWNEALRAAGVATALDGGSLFDALEVRLARAWLSMLASPRDRAAAAVVLVSELYGVSQRTMVRLTLQRVSGSPKRALALADEQPELLSLSEFERRALRRCEDDLTWCRAALRQLPLPQAVEAALERVELADRLCQRLGEADAAQLRANLVALAGYAHRLGDQSDAALSLTEATGATLENLLQTLERAAESEVRMPSSREAGGDAVRLVTLHGSKGMEYPVVVLDVLAHKLSARLPRVEVLRPTDADTLLGDGALQASAVQLIPEVGVEPWRERFARSFDAEARARAEWLRLLYVGVTRAREHLVVLWPEATKGATVYVSSLVRDVVPAPPAGSASGVDGDWLGVRVRAFAAAEGAATPREAPPSVELGPWRSMVEDPCGTSDLETPEASSGAPRSLARVSPSDLCQVNDCPEVLRIARFVRGERHELARSAGEPARVRDIPAIWRARADVPRSVAASRVGTLVHAAVERARWSSDALTAVQDELLAAEVLKANGQGEHVAELTALIVGTLTSLRAAMTALGCEDEPVREVPFVIDLRGSTLHGVVDLVVPTSSGLHVVDLKTHALRAHELPRWAAYYAPQLDAYALAVARLTGSPIAGRHLAVPAAGALVTLPGDFDAAAAEASLGALARRILDGARGPAQDCARCGWSDLCRVGRETLQARAAASGDGLDP
ncbi:MAG: UvrD-helicase domain-containing protein [Polyangiales bacterium]